MTGPATTGRETAEEPDEPSGKDTAGKDADEAGTDGTGTDGAAGPDLAGPPVVLPSSEVPEARGVSRLRLVQIYRVGSIVLGLVLLLSIALTGAAVHRNNEARDTLINRVDPATLQQFRLSSAIGRQDTAIREYAAGGGAGSLAEYRAAIAEERNAVAAMRRLLGPVARSGDVVRRLDRVTAGAAAWRAGFADPLAAKPGGRDLDAAEDAAARRLFAQVRGDITPLQQSLTTLHGHVADRLRARATTVLWALAVTIGLVVLAAIALALLIRRTVLNPVSSLSERVRAVAAGDFAHPLDISGSAEIHELSVIIDAMRRRILDEWRVSTEARTLLNQQTEELRRSNAELEQFAYVASHDLQEPLRKVASFCQMLERRYGDQLDERGRQYIEFAVDGAKRMQSLINDLLGFSRVGRISRFEEAIDLNEVARQAVDNLSALIEETGAEVDVGELPTLPGDRTQFTQLFQNLIGNAIKFRREGVPPRVTVDAHRTDGEWEFRCADNGIGIEPRYADRIFLIFQRLHQRDQYTGTGIGLALCKKIVEYHGGRIWLDTEDRDTPGTTFHWTLPAGEANE
ncbi:sensor histidine kinase [Actinomadura fibrosa]|uniref:histidine kinase n=1 Tax=Actinomadura fibrosa TaxID=111802 RepID=A0ABW2XCF6_9ACTN|nr:ATP-binding protein [Actinomadura fibrosa]